MIVLEQHANKLIRLVLPNGELLTLEFLGERSNGATKLAIDSTTEISIIRKKLGFSVTDQIDTAKANVG